MPRRVIGGQARAAKYPPIWTASGSLELLGLRAQI